MGIAKFILKKGISFITKSVPVERKAAVVGKDIFGEASGAVAKTVEKNTAGAAVKTGNTAVKTENSVFDFSKPMAAPVKTTEKTAVKAEKAAVTSPQTKTSQAVQPQSVKPQLTPLEVQEKLQFPRLEDALLKTSKYHSYSNETKKVIDEFCAELLRCAKNRNDSKYYKNIFSKISFLVHTCNDEKAVKILMSDAKKFTDYLTNDNIILEEMGFKIKGYKFPVLNNLALMKTLNPESFNALWKSKGMKEIIEGRLNIDYLKDVKVFDKIDEDFFYKMFDKIEKANSARLKKAGIAPEQVNKYLKIYDKEVCMDPKFADKFITKLEEVNNPELVNGILKKCEFERFWSATFNDNLIKTLGYAVTDPQIVAKALRIKKANMWSLPNLVELMKNKNEFKISDELFERFLKFEKANPECCYPATLSCINDFLKVKGADEKLVQKIFDSAEDLKKNIGAGNIESLFSYTKENNIDILKTSLEKGKLSPEDLFKLKFVTSSDKRLTDEAMSKLYKETFAPISKELASRSGGEFFAERLAMLKSESPATYQKLMDINITDLIKKENFDPAVLREYIAALDNPAIYGRLKESKLLELIKDKKVSPRIILQMEYGELRPEVVEDIQKLLKGESLIKKFDTTKDVLKKTKAGDVISVQGKMYINNKGKLEEWNMTEEKFNELFPLVDRFVTSQGKTIGDCYLLTALDGLYKNPLTRGEYYKMFGLGKNGISVSVTIPAYKDFKGTIYFKNGSFTENGIGADAAPHVQMIEKTYARTALRSKNTAGSAAINPGKTGNNRFLYKRIVGGLEKNVVKEIIPTSMEQKGVSTAWYYKSKTTVLSDKGKKRIEEFLKNYANNTKYVISYGYRASANGNHAVAVCGYDALTKTVTLRNPWYFGVEYKVSLDEFFQKYMDMTLSRIG